MDAVAQLKRQGKRRQSRIWQQVFRGLKFAARRSPAKAEWRAGSQPAAAGRRR
jgi:hypothetical protein